MPFSHKFDMNVLLKLYDDTCAMSSPAANPLASRVHRVMEMAIYEIGRLQAELREKHLDEIRLYGT
jgi:hypothetical protein